jgi:hypothetical protein
MPTPNPPQPPVIINPAPTPQPPIYIPVSGQPANNNVNVTTPSNSSSVSEAENSVNQAASLNSYQVNSNHESSYYKYSNNVVMPGTSVYGDLSVINDQWDWNRTNVVASVGVRHTFGGIQKKLAVQSVQRDNLSKSLAVCEALGVFEGKVVVDYKMMPDLAPCAYITQKVAVDNTASNELKLIRQEMEEYKLLLQKQKQDVNYYQQKIEREYELGTSVRVGG